VTLHLGGIHQNQGTLQNKRFSLLKLDVIDLRESNKYPGAINGERPVQTMDSLDR
jgi:hypothetical protein